MAAVEQLHLIDSAVKPFGGKRYCKVAFHDKNAVKKGFLENPLSMEEIKPWLTEGCNYAVIAGKGLIIIDLDDPTLAEKIPETLTVETGRKGLHLYYRSNITDNAVLDKNLENGEKENVGHVQVKRKYVLGPGSIHPNGNIYTIKKDLPLAWITKDQLDSAFNGLIKWHSKEEYEKQANAEYTQSGILISKVADLPKLTKRNNDEYQGAHPIHGSETGQNFCVNITKNVWHCFRHETGGGPLQLIAVLEGIIECEDATPGALRGDLFKQTLQIAKEKYGYVEPENQENNANFPEFFIEDKKGRRRFQPVVFAEYLMTRYHFKTTVDDETVFVYDEQTGIYLPKGEAIIKEELARYLQEETHAYYLIDVLFYIKARTHFERPKTPINKIACINGLLNIETQQLEPFTPDEFIMVKIPVSFVPGMDCPKIKEFIKEVVGDNATILQEATGYCLLQAYPFHTAFMYKGGGSNGKSTTINLQKRLLGAENVTSLTLQAICDDLSAKASLYGKLANLCADLPSKTLVNTGHFKTLTGNDPISARQLYKPYFNFTNTAKLFFSTNEVPKTTDDTVAFYRRWIIIDFPNVFTGEKCDPAKLSTLTTPNELAGLLNWVLAGLSRLIQNKGFSNPKTHEEKRIDYLKSSHSPIPFIQTTLETSLTPEDYIVERELYEKYVLWCKNNSFKPVRKGEFTQVLYQCLPGMEQSETRKDDKRTRVYRFIKYKSEIPVPPKPEIPETPKNKDNPQTLAKSATGDTGGDTQTFLSGKNTDRKKDKPLAAAATPVEEIRPTLNGDVTCGDCANWHKGGCIFSGDPSCIAPTNTFAAECKGFISAKDVMIPPLEASA